jgi:hypothetical protein
MKRRALVRLALLLVASLVPLGARAQQASTGIAAERFVPALGPTALVTVEGAAVSAPLQTSFAASVDYLRDPIKLSERYTDALLSRPVHEQLVTDVAVELGVWKRLAVALGVPVVLYQSGDRLRGTGLDDRPLQTTVAGDLRVRAKAQLVGDATQPGWHAALLVQMTTPVGGQHDFAATSGFTIEPRLIADWQHGRVTLAASAGARFAPERNLFTTQFSDELTFGAGAALVIVARGRLAVSALAECVGAVGAQAGTRPVELRGAVRLQIGRFSVEAGSGGGVDGDLGAPAWRLFAVARGQVGWVR